MRGRYCSLKVAAFNLRSAGPKSRRVRNSIAGYESPQIKSPGRYSSRGPGNRVFFGNSGVLPQQKKEKEVRSRNSIVLGGFAQSLAPAPWSPRQDLPRRGTEVVVTGAPRKRLARKGTWVRIPPSPPAYLKHSHAITSASFFTYPECTPRLNEPTVPCPLSP